MTNYWYIERENEILLDCDLGFNWEKAHHIVRIFSREITSLYINGMFDYLEIPSTHKGHCHVAITVPPMSRELKFALAVMLGSDKHREIISYGQWKQGKENPYLLVSTNIWTGRDPDHICTHPNWRECECLRKIQPV